MTIKLPIDLIPNTTPPRFTWRQIVNTPIGPRTVEHEGVMLPSVEDAVLQLVILAKQQMQEITGLQRTVEGLTERTVVQSGTINMAVDRLGGMVEGNPTHEGNFLQRVDELVAIETRLLTPAPQVTSIKKSKG